MSRLVRAEAFIDGACRETGLDDFGVEGWRANLAVLVDALNDEAALSELGEQLVWQWMGRRLVNRLRLVDYRRRHPEIDDQRVARPLFVCGMMRTGTTVLYELLHADPRARCLMKWESMACVPPPRAGSFDDDPRVVEARRQVAEVFERTPEAKAAHYEAPDGPTECVELLTQHFAAQDWSWWHVPSYIEHFNHCDMRAAMIYHRQCLQVLQSQAPGRWTLKAPAHLLYLDALFESYPDARVVITHRDPVRSVASMAHMSASYRPEILSDRWDHGSLERYYGDLWLESLGTMVDKMMDYRAAHPDAAVYDLFYEDLVGDPLAAVAALYARLGEDLDDSARSRMGDYLQENPQHRHGRREFSLKQFGLSESRIRDRFTRYYETFDVRRGR